MVVYPNPVTSPTVNIFPPTYSGVSNVEVEIFTLAFRKVQENTHKSKSAGQDCPVTLVDRSNRPLANGVYYVVVTTNAGHSVGKMMILR